MVSSTRPAEDVVAELVAQFRPDRSPPQAFYNDPAVYARDIERIFFHDWMLIDHASRIPLPGDYFLFEIAGESIIVVRGKDGEVHAHFNVCRHRGSRLCTEPSGSAAALVCPYHAWSFALDGRLLAARAMPADFDRAEFSLRPCAIRLVEGLIFISLAAEPPAAEPAFRHWEAYLRPHGLKEAKIAHRVTWKVKANWKILVENFLECYHCGPAHPEYCSVMHHARPASGLPQDAAAYQAFEEQWTEWAKAQGTFRPRVILPGEPYCMAQRIPIKEGFLTQSRNGTPVAPLMGDFKAYDGGVTTGEIGLFNYFIAPNDYVLIPRFTPLTVDTSEMEMLWLVRGDAVAGVDYQVEDLAWLWRVTTDQDKIIIEDTQAGVNSRAYTPGPLATVEWGMHRFTAGCLKAIS